MNLKKRLITAGFVSILLLMNALVFWNMGTEGLRARDGPSIVDPGSDVYPPGTSDILKEGSPYNSIFSVNVTDIDSSSLDFSWYVDATLMNKSENVGPKSGSVFESKFQWIPSYDSAGLHVVKVVASDGTDETNYTWTDVRVIARSGSQEMNTNSSISQLSIKISYLYDNAPEVDVRSGLTVSETTGNKTFGTPILGFFYDVLYNITTYLPSAEHPWPTVEFINMSINYTTSGIKQEFERNSIRIVAWDFTRGIWNDIENIGEYEDLNLEKGLVPGKDIAWLNLTLGAGRGTRTTTRSNESYSVEYLFHLGLFGNRPLRVTDTEPADNATDVDQVTNITASLNQLIFDADTIKQIIKANNPTYTDEEVNATLYNLTYLNETYLASTSLENAISLSDGSTPVNGSIVYDRSYNKLIFVPDTFLKENTTYTARVSKNIKDIFNHTLDGNENFVEGEANDDYVWHFKTKKISTIVPGPQVVSTYPTNGQKDVPLNTTITVTFDSDMDEATFAHGITMINSKGAVVSVTTAYDAKTRTLNITPAGMEPNEQYEITLKYTIKDVNGNGLDGNGDGMAGVNSHDDYYFSFYTVTVEYGNISGKVTDKSNGTPLPNIEIRIDSIGRSVFTDANGSYTFNKIPVGTYEMTVRDTVQIPPNYKTTTVNITVKANTVVSKDIQLEYNPGGGSGEINEAPIVSSIYLTPKKEDNTYTKGNMVNFTVNATDKEGDVLNYTWYIETSPIANLSNVVGRNSTMQYTFTNEGTYYVTVLVTDGHDNEVKRDVVVRVRNSTNIPTTGNTTTENVPTIMGLSQPVFIGVVIAVILLIAVIGAAIRLTTMKPEEGDDEEEEEEEEEETYACPNCGKQVPMSATKCPYCGENLEME